MRRVAVASFGATALLAILLQWCGPTHTPDDAGSDAADGGIAENNGDAIIDGTVPCIHATVAADCRGGWCRVPSGCYQMGSPQGEWGRGFNTEDIIDVTLTHAFIIQQYELTQGQWVSVGIANRAGWFDGGAGNSFGDCVAAACPASTMTWYEAVQFANVLSSKDGRPPCYELKNCGSSDAGGVVCESVSVSSATVYDCLGYRLPTEAEWEYAARAGTTTAFYNGPITPQTVQGDCNYDKNLNEVGWYCWNSDATTHPVGLKRSNLSHPLI